MWVNNSLFKLQKNEIPALPVELSEDSRLWWKEQRRRCIEGYWVGGKWMPGCLYFYINFWSILINKDRFSKVKVQGSPELWDIMWDMAYGYMEARGFAGFSQMKDVQKYMNMLMDRNIPMSEVRSAASSLGDPKDIMQNTTKNLGAPMMLHEAKNMMIMGNRGFGKSFFVAGAIIGHGFLFDGLYEYKPSGDVKEAMQIAIGAGDAKYSTTTLSKVKYGLERLAGAIKIGGQFYPSPFTKQFRGTFKVGGEIEAVYDKQEGNNWVTVGTGAIIYHRTFKDNPFAFNGLRAGVGILEEIGMFDNLIQASNATEDVMKDGEYKFGTQVMIGTGGDMGSGTVDASRMFYDTETYKLVSYNDIWENKGKIAMFIPTTLGTHQYKDNEGNTNLLLAEKEDDEIREKIRKSKNASSAMDARKQNQPRVPSEMFLSKVGNIFPRGELQVHLSSIESNNKILNAEDVGELFFRDEGNLKWEHLSKDRAIRVFPHDLTKDDCRGATTIWHHPIKDDEGHIPNGLYLAGLDPYDHDESGTMSLGSLIVYMKMFPGKVKETIVAEYTGRHEKGSDAYYEQVRRILIYYNAKLMFENNLIGVYKYFERKNCTYLMMDTPEYAKEMGTQPNRPKGMHFGTAQIVHGELLIKNFLEEEIIPGVLRLTTIKSVPLLKELIGYNRKGNFDRVRALMCVMYAREETFRENFESMEIKAKTLADDPFFKRNYNNTNSIRKNIFDIKGSIDAFKDSY